MIMPACVQRHSYVVSAEIEWAVFLSAHAEQGRVLCITKYLSLCRRHVFNCSLQCVSCSTADWAHTKQPFGKIMLCFMYRLASAVYDETVLPCCINRPRSIKFIHCCSHVFRGGVVLNPGVESFGTRAHTHKATYLLQCKHGNSRLRFFPLPGFRKRSTPAYFIMHAGNRYLWKKLTF